MNERIIPRETVAQNLSISPQVLIRYERMGLVRSIQEGEVQGYEPAQVRRIWAIMTYQRDMGVNMAGVEVILRLREHMATLHHDLKDLAGKLQVLVDAPETPDRPR